VSAAVRHDERAPGDDALAVNGLALRDAPGVERLRDVTFGLRAGEILAVAGVDGNGQADLVDVLAGLKAPSGGRIALAGRDITRSTAGERLAAGLAYIPVDRAGTALVPDMTIEDNLALRDFGRAPLCRGLWLDRSAFRTLACLCVRFRAATSRRSSSRARSDANPASSSRFSRRGVSIPGRPDL
jgi:simple sugar transport system ATP-binding protein